MNLLGQFPDDVMHIPGEDKCSGDLLSRWRRTSADADGELLWWVGYGKIAVCASADVVYALPSKSAMKSSQLQTRVQLMTMSCGTARCKTEEFFGVSQSVNQTLRIPAEDERQQPRRAQQSLGHVKGALVGGGRGW